MTDYLHANQQNWNDRVAAHLADRGDFYDVTAFLAGESSLRRAELDLLPDVAGQSLLHLMCHFGLDTLSLARLGASVTGVDFAGDAIKAARDLAARANLAARFVQADVFDLPNQLSGTFDIVYASHGVLAWLPDFERFIAVAAHFLRPGGHFYFVDIHPFIDMLAEDPDEAQLVIAYPYFHQTDPEKSISAQSYANPAHRLAHPVTYQWGHHLAAMFQAARRHGLHITDFREYPFLSYQRFSAMVQIDAGDWGFPTEPLSKIPLLFGLTLQKPA